MTARARLALPAALVCLLPACSPPPEPLPQRHVVSRFIETPPAEVWSAGNLVAAEEIRRWRLGEPREHAAWTVRNADLRNEPVGIGLALISTHRRLQLAREVDLDASGIDAFEIGLDTRRGVSVALEWRRLGQAFSRDRRIRVPPYEVTPGPEGTARVDVGAHPGWTGRIDRLRITFGVPREQPVMVRHLTALRTTSDPEALIDATSRPWLIDLEGEARPAYLTPPGLAVERELSIPAAAMLDLGYCVPGDVPGAVRFRAVFLEEGDDRDPVEIFSAEVAAEGRGSWHDAEIDLAGLAGRRGRLRLETELAADLDPYRQAIPAWSNPQIVAPAGPGDRRLPHAVLISIDTLRADRLSLYGNPRPTSPNLDAWAARRATVFETAVASAPWTLPAHTTLFTGLDAHRHGVNYDFDAPQTLETLAERLRAAGYRTLAVTGGGFLAPQYGLAQGFDRFVHFTRREPGSTAELESGIATAQKLIAEAPDRPFFLFFHTYEVHGPYSERQPFFEQLTGYRAPFEVEPSPRGAVPEPATLVTKSLRTVAGAESARAGEESAAGGETTTAAQPPPAAGDPRLTPLARDLYDSSVALTDDRLQQLFATLERLGLADRTAVVVTADHGEMLGEHGVAGHQYLYDQNLLVPLVIAAPGAPSPARGAGLRVRPQVRQADVMPTLLELLGLPSPTGLDGRSLVPLMRGDGDEPERAALSYSPRSRYGVSWRSPGGAKQVLRTTAWEPMAGEALLYDLTADPEEAAPGTADRRLDRRLRQLLTDSYRGLLLEIAAGAGGLTVEVQGPAISLYGVHSLDGDCDCVRFESEGRAHIEVPPNRRIALRLEDPAGKDLKIGVEIPGSAPESRGRTKFRLSAPRAQRLEWTGSRWRRGGPRSATGRRPFVALRWQGNVRQGSGGNVSEREAEVREQLRALGYL